MTTTRSVEALACVVSSLFCSGSFAWALKCLFRGNSRNATMTSMKSLGAVFALWQIALLMQSRVSPSFVMVRLAVGLYLVSATLFWWATLVIGRRRFLVAFVPNCPQELIESGPYRFVRHPLYTSYLLYWFAGLMATGASSLVFPVIVMAAFYVTAARQEEREFLTSDLSREYACYMASTAGFVPKLW